MMPKGYAWYVITLGKYILEYAEFNGDVQFFCFWPEIHFLRKFGPKIQIFLFKVKFDT